MAGRLDNLEKYITLLTTKLQEQEQRNGELVATIARQGQQRDSEKVAFVKAVGVLQGAVTQLANRVDIIPKMLEKANKKRYKEYLASSINSMSEKIGELGNSLRKTGEQQIQVRDTRSQTAGELLGKLLGKDLEKALEGITSDKSKDNKGEAKDTSSAIGTLAPGGMAPASSVIATNTQPLVPIDLLPQSHVTSLSTPTGQGPAGSASSNPVLPNLPSVQLPLPANIPAKSTPTGSGPYGSVSTMPIADQAATPLTSMSITSVASKFKPPVNMAGYNVLPLTPVQVQQPLEPPGLISSQPNLPSLINPGQTVPGAVNPYEVLTSAQMQPSVVQPAGFNGAVPLPAAPQAGNPYEALTTDQIRPIGYPVAKEKVAQKENLGKKGKIRKTGKNFQIAQKKIGRRISPGKENEAVQKKLKNTGKNKKVRPDKKGERKKKTSFDFLKDPLRDELDKAIKIGHLKRVRKEHV